MVDKVESRVSFAISATFVKETTWKGISRFAFVCLDIHVRVRACVRTFIFTLPSAFLDIDENIQYVLNKS